MKLYRFRCRLCSLVKVTNIRPNANPELCPHDRTWLLFLYEEAVDTPAQQALYQQIQEEGPVYRQPQEPIREDWHCFQCEQLQPGSQRPFYDGLKQFCTVDCRNTYRKVAWAHTDDNRRERLQQLEQEQDAIMSEGDSL